MIDTDPGGGPAQVPIVVNRPKDPHWGIKTIPKRKTSLRMLLLCPYFAYLKSGWFYLKPFVLYLLAAKCLSYETLPWHSVMALNSVCFRHLHPQIPRAGSPVAFSLRPNS